MAIRTSRISGCLGTVLLPATMVMHVAIAAGPADECAAIESAQERLACFDAAFGTEVGAPPEPAPPSAPVTGAQAAEPASMAAPASGTTPSATPGASSDDAGFGLDKSMDELEGESLSSNIVSVGKDGFDKLLFELENGQLWRQTEYKYFPVQAGQVAVISHGAMGSYKLYIDGENRWTRVRRVE